jgi:ribosomal protein S18 acetylase RimI-like enzyme
MSEYQETTHPEWTIWASRVVIRPVEEADLPGLEWNGELIHFRRLFADIYSSMKKGKATMWAAELEEVGIIGQLFVQFNSARIELADGANRAYIYGFRIRPEYRGVGLGTRMMFIAEKDLLQRGFRRVTLNVSQKNVDAKRLYEKLGYRVVALEPGRWSYKDHRGHLQKVNDPSWRMEKRFSSPGPG